MNKGDKKAMVPLGLLSPGELGEIADIRSHGKHGSHSRCATCTCDKEKSGVRMEDMGLRIGKSVEMLTNGSGPILLRVDESRIAIDRGLAMKIMVWR